MDGATRAELDRLRLRAYGPGGDIDADADALGRLVELEELVRQQHGGARHPLPSSSDADGPASARPDTPRGAAPAPAAKRRRPALSPATWFPLVVGIAAVCALAVALVVQLLWPPAATTDARTTLPPVFEDSRAAYSFARDMDAVTLLSVPLDGSFGSYIDLPTDGYVPEFPTDGEVRWAMPLGEYFGWDVWIAGAQAGATGSRRDHCLVAERDDRSRGRCVPAAIRAESALLVDVPFASIPAGDRPAGMTEDQRVGFWWSGDRAVTVLLGDDPLRGQD